MPYFRLLRSSRICLQHSTANPPTWASRIAPTSPTSRCAIGPCPSFATLGLCGYSIHRPPGCKYHNGTYTLQIFAVVVYLRWSAGLLAVVDGNTGKMTRSRTGTKNHTCRLLVLYLGFVCGVCSCGSLVTVAGAGSRVAPSPLMSNPGLDLSFTPRNGKSGTRFAGPGFAPPGRSITNQGPDLSLKGPERQTTPHQRPSQGIHKSTPPRRSQSIPLVFGSTPYAFRANDEELSRIQA